MHTFSFLLHLVHSVESQQISHIQHGLHILSSQISMRLCWSLRFTERLLHQQALTARGFRVALWKGERFTITRKQWTNKMAKQEDLVCNLNHLMGFVYSFTWCTDELWNAFRITPQVKRSLCTTIGQCKWILLDIIYWRNKYWRKMERIKRSMLLQVI